MESIFKVKGKIKVFPLILFTLGPLLVSVLVFLATKNSINIYSKINKPIIAPPNYIFMIVWPILYILMGLAAYRVYMYKEEGIDIGDALFYYVIQLLLNYLWSFIFFSFRLYGLAFIELIVLFIFIVITFFKFSKIDRMAGYLLIPYILWCGFALFLNYFIWSFNER